MVVILCFIVISLKDVAYSRFLRLLQTYAREIVRIESGCAAGTMSGDAVCRDVVMVSTRLRQKVKEGDTLLT